MFKKLNRIIQGWTNYIWESHDIRLMAEQRAVECSGCENALYGKVLSFLDDDVKEIEGMYCGLCDCPLSTLLRSPESQCKINLWQSKTF